MALPSSTFVAALSGADQRLQPGFRTAVAGCDGRDLLKALLDDVGEVVLEDLPRLGERHRRVGAELFLCPLSISPLLRYPVGGNALRHWLEDEDEPAGSAPFAIGKVLLLRNWDRKGRGRSGIRGLEAVRYPLNSPQHPRSVIKRSSVQGRKAGSVETTG